MTLAVPLRDDSPPFDELARSPYFAEVVTANRQYLTTVLPDALAGGPRRATDDWALVSMPRTGGRFRLTSVAMGRTEVFAVFKPLRDEALTAKVMVSAAALAAAGVPLPGLELVPSTYLAAGDDQMQVYGPWATLAPALAGHPLRTAARALAERLLPVGTTYARFHDARLAATVLARD